MSYELERLQMTDKYANMDIIPRMYCAIFDSAPLYAQHRVFTQASIVSAENSVSIYVSLLAEESFYLEHITAFTDTDNTTQSPLIKITDPSNGASLIGPHSDIVFGPQVEFVNVLSAFTPGNDTRGIRRPFTVNYWFKEQSQIRIEAINSGVGGARTLQLMLSGKIIKDKLV